jgi:hypothetical protein
LRRASDNGLLASLIVSVENLEEMLQRMGVQSLDLAQAVSPPQRIRTLHVIPLVDTVRVSFRTIHPTIPLIEVETLEGENLAKVWPLFLGLQTRHTAVIGYRDPLPQGSELRLRITVPGHRSRLTRLTGPAKDVVRTVRFWTGVRQLWVSYDSIHVRADGDPGWQGAGEFVFGFYAGDADDKTYFSGGLLVQDIEADSTVAVVESGYIPLPTVKRKVALFVRATDFDFGVYLPGEDFSDELNSVGFRFGEGSDFRSTRMTDEAWVSHVVDVTDVTQPGFQTIPFTLSTGNFDVAFSVDGSVQALVRPSGVGFADFEPRTLSQTRPTATLSVEGRAAGVMSKKSGHRVLAALGADGSIFLKHVTAGKSVRRSDGWKSVAPTPGGPVTVILENDRPLLLAVDWHGEAVAWTGRQGEDGWVRLGARLTSALVAAEGLDGRIDVFGVDTQGIVLHCSLAPDRIGPCEWLPIGESIDGNLVVQPHAAGTALFAVDREGHLVHALYRNHSERLEWQRIAGPNAAWVDVAAMPGQLHGLLVSVLTDERDLHVLHWQDYPEGDPRQFWQEKGCIDTALPMRTIKNAARELPKGDLQNALSARTSDDASVGASVAEDSERGPIRIPD